MSALKLPVLKTREYDIEQYLTFIDHALWDVILNGDLVSPVASASTGAEGPIPLKTAEQKPARKNKLKAKSTLMLAIPDEHLLKFHACKDAKSLWEAIKNRLGGNKESKKMQKTILKQNYENFAASSQEGLDKTYYRRTNETVNTAHSVSTASSKDQASTASYADDVMFSFFANQSNAPQLEYEDLEQIDADDLEDVDLKWQVAMLTIRVKRLNATTAIGGVILPKNEGHQGIRGIEIEMLQQGAQVDTSTINALVVQNGIGYQIGLESLEARIVVHEKNEDVYEEDIAFLKYDVQVKDISIKDLKFEESLKNLTKLIDSQISAKYKTGLGYDSQMNESEVVHSVTPRLGRNTRRNIMDLITTQWWLL
ncbi:hypothetical protein Tco_1425760 [Tanacetum coccineum]